uniref:Uncharacterized protein n=1 Tax=Aegilops tauschii subsp. strangulata TaxID=200361 RepID=A0A453NBV6_AEGTS
IPSPPRPVRAAINTRPFLASNPHHRSRTERTKNPQPISSPINPRLVESSSPTASRYGASFLPPHVSSRSTLFEVLRGSWSLGVLVAPNLIRSCPGLMLRT